ncbi:hypothetical protein FISHEDRAFT_61402 [Fistulina hepatica ATCC 64428]|uniref:C2H2-type domain-containing protein n=1 Tax=Fistulina hepatica ATCC 64428 TaxID=1128425 RepID=A0A0D7A2N3_9AGAR|nr:hypothetical protein FISHEDRAFT_61402 [Fistulina hepatica ATCC 64428]
MTPFVPILLLPSLHPGRLLTAIEVTAAAPLGACTVFAAATSRQQPIVLHLIILWPTKLPESPDDGGEKGGVNDTQNQAPSPYIDRLWQDHHPVPFDDGIDLPRRLEREQGHDSFSQLKEIPSTYGPFRQDESPSRRYSSVTAESDAVGASTLPRLDSSLRRSCRLQARRKSLLQSQFEERSSGTELKPTALLTESARLPAVVTENILSNDQLSPLSSPLSLYVLQPDNDSSLAHSAYDDACNPLQHFAAPGFMYSFVSHTAGDDTHYRDARNGPRMVPPLMHATSPRSERPFATLVSGTHVEETTYSYHTRMLSSTASDDSEDFSSSGVHLLQNTATSVEEKWLVDEPSPSASGFSPCDFDGVRLPPSAGSFSPLPDNVASAAALPKRKRSPFVDDDDGHYGLSFSSSDLNTFCVEKGSPRPRKSRKNCAQTEEPIICKPCNRSFKRPGDYSRHMTRTQAHAESRQKCVCPQCYAELAREDSLKRHLVTRSCHKRHKKKIWKNGQQTRYEKLAARHRDTEN